MRIFIDQYSHAHFAATIKDLRANIGGGAVSKMYRDKANGATVHVGYIIGQLWLTEVTPVERAA